MSAYDIPTHGAHVSTMISWRSPEKLESSCTSEILYKTKTKRTSVEEWSPWCLTRMSFCPVLLYLFRDSTTTPTIYLRQSVLDHIIHYSPSS